MEAIIALIFIAGLFIWKLSFHYLLMPYLLMIALEALGHPFSFIVCLAFWTVARILLGLLRPRKIVNQTNNKN